MKRHVSQVEILDRGHRGSVLRNRVLRFHLLWTGCFAVWNFAAAQNVIEDRATGPTAPPITVSEAQATALLATTGAPVRAQWKSPQATRIARRLDRHVVEFLDGAPWKPFQHTLGISGYEVYFAHPDEMFYALSLALPFLQPATAERTRAFVEKQLSEAPPYVVDGFAHRVGRAREAYNVPETLRVGGRGRARSIFGVYAFETYVRVTTNHAAASQHWERIKQRVQPLVVTDYRFDVTKRHMKDEAEVLSGDLAGLIGAIRLAHLNSDAAFEQQAVQRARQLLELRVNLERVNPRIIEPTESSTKHLHAGKLARFCALVPEVGEAVRTMTDGCGAARLRDFREARNAWYLAFGDRMIGGENYTNPVHFSRALFAGAAFVEQLPPEQLATFVDVPWCKGDFYFIEKCALVLARMQ